MSALAQLVCNTERMGRHSAPGDDEDGDVLITSAIVIDAPRSGRHARPDEESESSPPGTQLPFVAVAARTSERLVPPEPETDLAAEPTVEVAREPAAEVELVADASVQKVAPQVRRGSRSTVADLELLRAHSDVRARVIAAVVAPFVIYTLAMYLGSALDLYFIWVWLPLVTAGVLAGSILDAAHRKRARDAASG